MQVVSKFLLFCIILKQSTIPLLFTLTNEYAHQSYYSYLPTSDWLPDGPAHSQLNSSHPKGTTLEFPVAVPSWEMLDSPGSPWNHSPGSYRFRLQLAGFQGVLPIFLLSFRSEHDSDAEQKKHHKSLHRLRTAVQNRHCAEKVLSMTLILKRELHADRPPLNGTLLVMTIFYIDKLYRSVYHLSTLSLPFYHSHCLTK